MWARKLEGVYVDDNFFPITVLTEFRWNVRPRNTFLSLFITPLLCIISIIDDAAACKQRTVTHTKELRTINREAYACRAHSNFAIQSGYDTLRSTYCRIPCTPLTFSLCMLAIAKVLSYTVHTPTHIRPSSYAQTITRTRMHWRRLCQRILVQIRPVCQSASSLELADTNKNTTNYPIF